MPEITNKAALELLAQVHLRDAERARQNLERIAERVPAGVAAVIPPLLTDVPDPDAALNLFERLTVAAVPEVFHLLERNHALVHYALVVFGYSQFLGETLIQNPDLFQSLQRDKVLDRSHSREDYHESFARFQSRSFDSDMALLLARFKRREYIRIMLRDVLGIATLAEVTSEISALADVLIEEALRSVDSSLRNRFGAPQHKDSDGRLVDTPAAVLSLGKLGGNELNYSSDVDLLFLYGEGEDAGGASISSREYFIRLAQGVTEVLSRSTREGWTFRIDLRLRPQGGEGEPAIALDQAMRYYAEVAHDWELQAMIKVRPSAGDVDLARRFIRGVQPYVYTPQVNFPAIETALEARDRISTRRRTTASRGRASVDVKLDRGGIRDLEFLVQCLQRVYGGQEPWLRSGGTLFSLQKLHDKGHISGKEYQALTTAYEFLRRLEHRLQLRHGQQTHRLPAADSDLRILQRAMGGHAAESRAAGIDSLVRKSMAAVAEVYDRIIHQQQIQQQEEREFQLQGPAAELGREQSDRQILQRLAEDTPALYAIAGRGDLDPHVRRNLFKFLSSAFTSSERYAVVAEDPPAVERALDLFGASEYLADMLIRHPEEIATLAALPTGETTASSGDLFPAAGEGRGAGESDPVFEYLGSASVSFNDKLALLRRHYRHRVFASGARDVLDARPVYHSLAETTAAADEAMAAALDIAGHPEGFAVLALGRLGTMEFDLLSDADVIFVRDTGLESVAAARIAEQFMQALSTYTRDGTAFPVDARLRPNGAEGELVVTLSHLDTYFAHEAQAWEALTYTKLRFVAGSVELGEGAAECVARLCERFAADPQFVPVASDMRRRLEKSDATEHNFKTGPGGIYDVDFLVSQLLVRHGLRHARGNCDERLQALHARKLLSDADCSQLRHAALLLRTVEHAVRLVTGRARKNLPLAGHARQAAERLASRILRQHFPSGLAAELAKNQSTVRQIYDRLMQT